MTLNGLLKQKAICFWLWESCSASDGKKRVCVCMCQGIFCGCLPSPFYPSTLHHSGKNPHPLENYLSPSPWCPELQDRNLNLEWRETHWSQRQQLLGGKLWSYPGSCPSKGQLFSYSFGSVNYPPNTLPMKVQVHFCCSKPKKPNAKCLFWDHLMHLCLPTVVSSGSGIKEVCSVCLPNEWMNE